MTDISSLMESLLEGRSEETPDAPESRIKQIKRAMAVVKREPLKAAKEIIELREEVKNVAEAAQELQGTLAGLLTAKPFWCHVEDVQQCPSGEATVLTSVNGKLREIPVHPEVKVDDLLELEPWQCVAVHPEELIVTGVCDKHVSYRLAQGEIVEFRAYRDEAAGLAVVQRPAAGGEAVVTLSSNLRDDELKLGDRLILHRDNSALAIGVMDRQKIESKYEVSVDNIDTRLSDVVGVESVVNQLLEDLLLRLVQPEIGRRFQLEPLGGMILSSWKAGMGKTMLVRGLVNWLSELGRRQGFDITLFSVKPNELKSLWHGEDARLVRDELCGSIRARLDRPRTRPLFVLVVFDEIDSLGKRAGGNDSVGYVSPAQNDAVQALLVEMDGLHKMGGGGDPPASTLWIGLTNRPDCLDEALKRPGRFGDLNIEMPDYDIDAAEEILSAYSGGDKAPLPWFVDGEVQSRLAMAEVRQRLLRPAMARVFPLAVLRYATQAGQSVDVTGGEIMAGVHYKNVMTRAKRRAAARSLRNIGPAGIGYDDVVESLLAESRQLAEQLVADQQMLARQLRLKTMPLRPELVPEHELAEHRYLRPVAV